MSLHGAETDEIKALAVPEKGKKTTPWPDTQSQSVKVSGKTLIGAIERVTFHNEENGYCVLRVKPQDQSALITVVGNCPAPKSGEQLVASGEWHDDENYGAQFRAEEITTSEPGTLAGIERYLGSGLIEGIGPVYAKKMVAKFGAEIFDVIDKRSKQLEEIEGIGSKRRKEIKESWQKQKAVRQIMVFLHQHGISTARAVRIYKTYGEQSISCLRKNPYQLAQDLHGVGFKTADKIAAKLGVQPDTRERIAAGLGYVMASAVRNGHCALPEQEIIDSSTELLGIDPEKIKAILDIEISAGHMARDTGNRSTLIFPPSLLEAEHLVARQIKELAGKLASYPDIDFKKALAWCENKIGYTLAGGQREAIHAALSHRMLVITGGPGVGKTTIINIVLMILRAKNITPVLCAPTGRAAKRMSESTGIEAKTIHRLLEYQPGQAGFARNRESPLEGDLFVIDEASMIDLPLMAAFMDALPENAHLLMIGDVDQLPSVGPGSVLSDLIQSESVAVSRLNEIFRQAAESRIIQAAHDINNGRAPEEFAISARPSPNSDFFFIERDDPDKAAAMIIRLLREQIPEKFGLDPLHDVQVLTPMHRGSLGTQALNRKIQDALNPANEATFEVERFGSCFRTGDRVIQLRNNYEKEIFNGDIGSITTIETDPGSISVRFDDGRTADYDPGELDELAPAFAITVHKSQGSEFPCVIVPVATQQFVLLQRNLIYTAITRGRRLVILVGQKKAAAMAMRNIDTQCRHRGLLNRLRQT